MKNILKNWKTTVGAVLIVASLALYFFNKITGEQLTVAVSTLAAAGLLAAKDGDKTGV